jgi:hypothetical protein
MMDRHFVVGPYQHPHPSIQINMYKFLRRKAVGFAISIGRELAEGPTVYLPDDYWGAVELWPLVVEEEKNALSR